MVLSRAQDLVSDAFVVDPVVQVERPMEGQEGACVSQLVCDQQYARNFFGILVGRIGTHFTQKRKQ